MTLYRQIALLFSVGYLILMIVLGWNDFSKSARIMQGQMEAVAQDMTTTAGIAVSSLLRSGDRITIDTLFNAIFDSGYYTRIELISAGGELLASRQQDVLVPDVPDWFVALVSIEPAQGHTQIVDGWLPYGTLTITLHPGYAYAQLYDNLRALLLWLSGLSIVGLGLLWMLLHRLLTPLRTTVEQADAISENRFIRQETLPTTQELRHVVVAMNRMVDKVQQVWHEQTLALRRYHDMQYRDTLTGLGNRRHFSTRLEECCSEENNQGKCLAIIYIHNLAELNKYLGYSNTDRLLKELGGELSTYPLIAQGGECARINSSEIAVLMDGSREIIEEFSQWLFDLFRDLLQQRDAEEYSWLALGVTQITEQCHGGDMLAAADFALARARTAGPYMTHITSTGMDTGLPQGKLAWRDYLQDALEHDRFFLAGQDVLADDGQIFHQELFVRLKNEQGQVVSAGTFMPVAAMLEMDYSIDQRVLAKTLELAQRQQGVLAVNLSHSVLSKASALAEFEEFLYQYVTIENACLHVETAHYTLLEHPVTAQHVATLLRQYGFSFGVEHLDLGASLDAIQQVRPHYLKINARRLDDMIKVSGEAPLQALRTMAKSMDMELIAVGVDCEEMRLRLQQAGFDHMLGHIISPLVDHS